MAFPDSILLIGVRGDQPAATDVAPGTLYSVTDESNLVEQSDGVVWVTYAGAGGGGGGAIGLSAGTQSVSTGTVVFSNSNGITFGMSGSSRITASHDGLTSQSNQNVTAGNGGFAFQTLSFSDINGVSFGTSAGSAITASHNALTSQSNQAASAANGSFAFQTILFSDANGVSFGTSAGSAITASLAALTSQSNQALSAANGSFTFQTAQFSNANGLSFSTSAGSAIFGSYTRPVVSNAIQAVGSATGSGTNTSRFAADDHVHEGVFSVGVTNAGNTVGDTRVGPGRFVLQGGNNVTLSQITAANALNTIIISGANAGGAQTGISGIIASDATYTSGSVYFSNQGNVTIGSSVDGASQYVRLSVAAQTNQTGGGYFVGNTTGQSSSSTYDARSLSIDGAGIVSVGWSNGSMRISATQSNQNVTAANGGFAFQTLSFSNANGFSFGTSAGSAITGSYTVPTVPAQLSVGVSTGGNTAGDTGVFTGRVVFVGSDNITLSGSSNAGSATVSILGGAGGGGATQTMFAPDFSISVSGLQHGHGTLMVRPMPMPDVQFDRILLPIYNTNATNSSGSHTLSLRVGIYTKNASTLSLVFSTSTSTAVTHSGTVGSYSLYSGQRIVSIPATTTLTANDYYIGIVSASASGGANGSYSQMCPYGSVVVNAYLGGFGVVVNNSVQVLPGLGSLSVTTAAIPDSIAFSDLQGTNSNVRRWPAIGFLSGTV